MAYISFSPKDYFNSVLYTGNGSTNAITGTGFQPDWVWCKKRNSAQDHGAVDAVRGVTKVVYPNLNSAESTDANSVTAFGTDGFTLGSSGDFNQNSDTYVSWNWRAGAGAGSSNTDGSINTTSTSVNTTAGFSISTYTGTGSNATIGHGLGAVPRFMLIKNRTDASTDWIVYHHALGNASVLHLNTTDNEQAASGVFNSTTPTSSVITLGTDSKSNGSGKNYVCYAFAEKPGFSKAGFYRGNNITDGTFAYTGFKPAFILMKRNTAGSSWSLIDNKIPRYNETDKYIITDTSAAEQSTAVDILSHGFKLRTTGGNQNASATYYFVAFADMPMVGSNNIPALAR